jgi:hypothetical protein
VDDLSGGGLVPFQDKQASSLYRHWLVDSRMLRWYANSCHVEWTELKKMHSPMVQSMSLLSNPFSSHCDIVFQLLRYSLHLEMNK